MKVMAATLPPLAAAGAVFLAGGALLRLLARGAPRPTRPQLGRAVASGLLLFVAGQGVHTLVLRDLTASLVAIVSATNALWLALLGAALGARLSAASAARLTAGFAGIALVLLAIPGAALGGSPLALAGAFLGVVAWSVGSLVAARGAALPADPRVAVSTQLLAGGVALLLLAAPLGQLDPAAWQGASGASLAAAGYLLLVDSLAGFLLYVTLLRTAPVPLVATYAYATPLVAAGLGVLVLAEPFTPLAALGAAVVLLAVAGEVRAAETAG
jgi:drug/metabolite transporter (DMT)-like permease